MYVWNGERRGGGFCPPLLRKQESKKRNEAEPNCVHLHTYTPTQQKSWPEREQKPPGLRERGERGGVLIERRVPRQQQELEVQQLSLSSSLSLGLCLASQWGGTSSLYALQLRLSVNRSTPPPCWHRQRATRKKRRGQGLTHQTKVAPIEAKAPNTLQIFTPYTHTHSSFSPPLCPVPLTALDVREGWDVRERIYIQISMTVTKTEKEC